MAVTITGSPSVRLQDMHSIYYFIVDILQILITKRKDWHGLCVGYLLFNDSFIIQ